MGCITVVKRDAAADGGGAAAAGNAGGGARTRAAAPRGAGEQQTAMVIRTQGMMSVCLLALMRMLCYCDEAGCKIKCVCLTITLLSCPCADGTEFEVGAASNGLDAVPVSYRDEVAAQLRTLQMLASRALGR